MPSEVECVYCKELSFLSKLVEGLLLYTGYFFKTHFLIFYFDGELGTIKVHVAYVRLARWFDRCW